MTEVDVASRCPKNTHPTGLVGSDALLTAAQIGVRARVCVV